MNASNTKLESALKTKAAMVIYRVEQTAEVIASLEVAAKTKLKTIDGRGEAKGFREGIKAATGPVVVLLGVGISDEVRAVLDEASADMKIIAITPAHSLTAEIAALFPMQLAANALSGRSN